MDSAASHTRTAAAIAAAIAYSAPAPAAAELPARITDILGLDLWVSVEDDAVMLGRRTWRAGGGLAPSHVPTYALSDTDVIALIVYLTRARTQARRNAAESDR